MKTTPETDLLPFVRRATHAELLAMVPCLSDESLVPRRLECECGDVPIGKRCPVCFDEPDVDAYPPWPALCAINEVLAPEPVNGISSVIDYSMTREERVERLIRRETQHFGLWNPADLVYIDHAGLIGENLERMIYTLSDYKARGCPDDVEHEPLRNGATIPGEQHLRKAG